MGSGSSASHISAPEISTIVGTVVHTTCIFFLLSQNSGPDEMGKLKVGGEEEEEEESREL